MTERNEIEGIVYSWFDMIKAGDPICWEPEDMDEKLLDKVAYEANNLFFGVPPDQKPTQRVNFIPLYPYDHRGMVKLLQCEDRTLRGNVWNGSLTVYFKEENDSIFYKYLDDFQPLFDEFENKIINLDEKNVDKGEVRECFDDFCIKITNILESLRVSELGTSITDVKSLKDRDKPEVDGLIPIKFKIIVCGDPGVGKTSLILQFTDHAFKRTYIPTLGVQLSEKEIFLEKYKIKFTIWDIAGQSRFKTFMKQFYNGTHALLLVFDLTRPVSYRNVYKWHQDIKNYLTRSPVGLIIGNKRDLSDFRKVDDTEFSQIQNDIGMMCIETSALTGENVDEIFQKLGNMLIDELQS
ncbi:MAG: GTP-binding protein [Candidatus Hodarchaeota archaeon]